MSDRYLSVLSNGHYPQKIDFGYNCRVKASSAVTVRSHELCVATGGCKRDEIVDLAVGTVELFGLTTTSANVISTQGDMKITK